MARAKPAIDPAKAAFDAALRLAAETDWEKISLGEISAEAELSLTDLYGVTDKPGLVLHMESWADEAMSAEPPDPEETPRERLFDAIMRRFELMEAHRKGVLSMMDGRSPLPGDLVQLLQARRRTAVWALAAAGLDTGPALRQAAWRLGLIPALRKAEDAWRSDASGDFARTMATLDAELLNIEERLDGLAQLRKRFGRGRPSEAGASRPEARPAETGEA